MVCLGSVPAFPEEVLRECERVIEDDLGFRVTFAVKDVQPRDDLKQVEVARFRNPFHAHCEDVSAEMGQGEESV